MSINAIAKKRLGFRNLDTGETLIVEPYAYSTLPDWVKKDPMYNWAVTDGSLEIPKPEKSTAPPKGGGEFDKQ